MSWHMREASGEAWREDGSLSPASVGELVADADRVRR